MTAYIATFHNADDNMTALVFESNRSAGGYGVTLRDDDSGETVGISIHGFKTIEEASAKAQSLV